MGEAAQLLRLCGPFVAGCIVAAGRANATPPSQAAGLRCEVVIAPSDSGSGRIGSAAPGRDGRLAWTDGRPGQFLVRDATGRARVTGRVGSGPGEFQGVGEMEWIGDTLWVADQRLPRVQFFGDTGRLLRVSTAILPANWGPSREGALVGFAWRALAGDLPFTVLLHRPGSTSLDTIASFPLVPAERFLLPAGGRMIPNPQPLLAETIVASSANHERFCGATPAGSYATQVRCVDARGRSIMNQRLALRPRPVTDSIYDAVIALFARAPGRTESDIRSRIRRPRSLPLVLGIMVDNDGEIWLKRSHRDEGTARWLRLRADGSIRDSVAFPGTYRPVRLQGDTMWVAHADSDGLDALERCGMGR